MKRSRALKQGSFFCLAYLQLHDVGNRHFNFIIKHSFISDIAPVTANIFLHISFQTMLLQVNDTIHSGSLPYQRCLISDIPEDAQQTVRYATNYIIVPLDMLVAFLSFLSNGLVLTTVIRTRSLQNPPMLLLCSLSISDLLWASFTIARGTVRYTSEGLCPEKDEGALFVSLCFGATVGNLVFISVDRYSAVSKPLLYRINVKRSRVFKQASAVWLSSLISSGFVYANEHSLISGIAPLVAIRFIYVFALIIIIFSYIGILIANIRNNRAIHQHGQGSRMLAMIKREKKLADTVGLILVVLLLTFLPAICLPSILLISGFAESEANLAGWRPFIGFIISLNGLLNPLVNYGRNVDVRKVVRALISCSKRTRRVVPPKARETAKSHSSRNATVLELIEESVQCSTHN